MVRLILVAGRMLAATLLFVEFSIYDELGCVRGDLRGSTDCLASS